MPAYLLILRVQPPSLQPQQVECHRINQNILRLPPLKLLLEFLQLHLLLQLPASSPLPHILHARAHENLQRGQRRGAGGCPALLVRQHPRSCHFRKQGRLTLQLRGWAGSDVSRGFLRLLLTRKWLLRGVRGSCGCLDTAPLARSNFRDLGSRRNLPHLFVFTRRMQQWLLLLLLQLDTHPQLGYGCSYSMRLVGLLDQLRTSSHQRGQLPSSFLPIPLGAPPEDGGGREALI